MTTHPLGLGALRGDVRRARKERLIRAAFLSAAALSILISVLIVVSLIGKAFAFLSGIELSQLWSDGWFPRRGMFDVKTILTGTLLVTGIGMIVAAPLGLGAALYLSEYARPRVRRMIKPVIELLAGIPTIVFGFFALTFFTPEILNGLVGADVEAFNALSAGIVMGFLVIPTIASISEDALAAVPMSLREAAYGLGASKIQVSLRVVFPAALSGVVASIVLGASRAIGETMIVLLAAGLFARICSDPRLGCETMTTYIGAMARGDIPTGSTVYKTVFAVGITLFVMTLLRNLRSRRFVRKSRQVYE